MRLKLEFEHEERLLALEEAQRAHEAANAETQKARDLRLAGLKEARGLCELELKAEQEKVGKEAAACEHELKMGSLDRHPLIG